MPKRNGDAATEPTPPKTDGLPPVVAGWFEAKGWQPRRHQLEMLERARARRSGLLVAATGAGKTLAGFLPTICELAELDSSVRAEPVEALSSLSAKEKAALRQAQGERLENYGLHTLYVSPLKALAVDVQR